MAPEEPGRRRTRVGLRLLTRECTPKADCRDSRARWHLTRVGPKRWAKNGRPPEGHPQPHILLPLCCTSAVIQSIHTRPSTWTMARRVAIWAALALLVCCCTSSHLVAARRLPLQGEEGWKLGQQLSAARLLTPTASAAVAVASSTATASASATATANASTAAAPSPSPAGETYEGVLCHSPISTACLPKAPPCRLQ